MEGSGKITRRSFLKSALRSAPVLLGGVSFSGLATRERPVSEKVARRSYLVLLKALSSKEPRDYGPTIAEFLCEGAISFFGVLDVFRSNNALPIPENPEPDGTLFFSIDQTTRLFRMGFRTSTQSDWVHIYTGEGSAGYWAELWYMKGSGFGNSVELERIVSYGVRDNMLNAPGYGGPGSPAGFSDP